VSSLEALHVASLPPKVQASSGKGDECLACLPVVEVLGRWGLDPRRVRRSGWDGKARREANVDATRGGIDAFAQVQGRCKTVGSLHQYEEKDEGLQHI
jgi:hypothetical protein